MSQFRMIRLQDIGKAFAIHDPRAVQGHWIDADSEGEALAAMSQRFPDDKDGFEVTTVVEDFTPRPAGLLCDE